MTADVRLLLDALEPELRRRGIPLENPETGATAATLAFAMTMDTRLRLRRQTANARDRASIDRCLRPTMREMARWAAWGLGILPLTRVRMVPLNAAGEDRELWALAAGVDHEALEAAVREVLSDLGGAPADDRGRAGRAHGPVRHAGS
jgi:hypothetical protein